MKGIQANVQSKSLQNYKTADNELPDIFEII